ncbi:MAG: carboxypeptidase regulatory-like domain-containing protein [Candidatus Helarchaeota archaeon]
MNLLNSKYKKIFLFLLLIFSIITISIYVSPILPTQKLDTSNNIKTDGYIEVVVYDSVSYSYLQYAAVTIENTSFGGSYSSTYYSNSVGFVNLTSLSVGWYRVTVSKDGYKTQVKDDYINWPTDDDYLNFYLDPWGPGTGYIEVQVNDSITGLPVNTALVQVAFSGNGTIITQGYTNSQGFFNATGLFVGWYDVTVSRTSYFTQTKTNYINWNGDDDYLQFYLEKGPPDSGWIEVTVNDNNSSPISGAYVTVQNLSTPSVPVIISGYTNGYGFFNATGLSVGWYRVNVSKAGYRKQSKTDYINFPLDDDYLSFYLEPYGPNSGYIEITVKAFNLSYINHAYVYVVERDTGNLMTSGFTDSNGFFNATGLPIGYHQVFVSKGSYFVPTMSLDYIHWNGDDDYLTIYLNEVDPEKLTVKVYVRRADAPWLSIPRAYVKFSQGGGTICESCTMSNGYAMGYNIVNTSLLTLEVSKAGYVDYLNTSIDLSGYDMPTTVELYVYLTGGTPGTGYIEVTVRDGINGSILISNANIELKYPNGTKKLMGQTNVNGFFNITDLYIGQYTINVSVAGYVSQTKLDTIHFEGDDDYVTVYLQRISFTSQILTLQTITPNPDPTGDINLVWNALYWVISYKIYRGTNPGDLELIATVGAGTTTYLDTGLTAGTTVFYQIIAENGSSQVPSNIESVSIWSGAGAGTIPGFEVLYLLLAIIGIFIIKLKKNKNFKSFFKI